MSSKRKKYPVIRNTWNRCAIPPQEYDLLLSIALRHGFREEQLFAFVLLMLQRAYPDDYEQQAGDFDLDWIIEEARKRRGDGQGG